MLHSTVAEPVTGADIVRLATGWLGTPYHHQASLKGVGCDCLGLVRGVYAEAYGRSPEEPPAYSRDLAEASHRETLLEAARRHLIELTGHPVEPGCVVVFRLRPGAMAKHCGIVSAFGSGFFKQRRRVPFERGWSEVRMIHAFEGAVVCEVPMSGWWQRRIAAVFRFPERL